MANPILPLNEYIPDGEPHVFGNRVYLYGSHDQANADRFCVRDYTVYSAPAEDLTEWTCHGVSYRKEQDPRSRNGKTVDLYAPDCVQGNDGRYYLYYSAMGPNTTPFGPMSVAVSEKPEGPFDYLGDVQYPDGTPVLKFLTNDPAVLSDNGRVYLYYGWGLGRDFSSKWLSPLYHLVERKLFNRSMREIRETKPSILSCAVVEMEKDMITVKDSPKAVLDSKTTADKNSELYQHAFYEAASIRKFDDLYYLVYSSGQNCELAYATSRYPDRDFDYRGVIISNADLGYHGNQRYHAAGGTIHGGIEKINGEYYVFYHRCTNNTNFSRQACAERIEIDETGFISQVEVTTQGTEKEPLAALKTGGKEEVWAAAMCCQLYNDKTGLVMGNGHNRDIPTIVNENGKPFITAIDDGTVIGYKYLNFANVSALSVTYRGSAGQWYVVTETEKVEMLRNGMSPEGAVMISLTDTAEWNTVNVMFNTNLKKAPLYFVFKGKGTIDFLSFAFQ